MSDDSPTRSDGSAQIIPLRPADAAAAQGSSPPTVDSIMAGVSDAAAKASKAGRPAHADKLLSAAGAHEFYRDRLSDHTYCDLTWNGVRRTYAIDGAEFKAALVRLSCALNNGTAMPAKAIQQVVETFAAKAAEAPVREVFLRFARRGQEVWIDLGDDTWQCLHVTSQGWQIVPYAAVPVRFRRPSGLLPLPLPQRMLPRNAAVALQQTMNYLFHLDGPQLVLLIVAMTAAMGCVAPHVIINFHGEPGSAKTTTMRLARQAIDPVRTPHINAPDKVEDLMVYARHHAVPCIDNASAFDSGMLDALCGIATGQGWADRAHYTKDEATDFMVTRPVWITSIDPVTARGDASSRALDLQVGRIDSSERKLGAEIDSAFNTFHPVLLGGLLEVLSAQLGGAPRPAELPRSADFYYWGLGAASILVPLGDFPTAFAAHKAAQARQAVEGNAVLLAVDALLSLDDPARASMTACTGCVIDHVAGRSSLLPLPPRPGTAPASPVPFTTGMPRRLGLKGLLDFDANGRVQRWQGRMSDLHHDLAAVLHGQETVRQPGWPTVARSLGIELRHAGGQLETALGMRVIRHDGSGTGLAHRPTVEIVRL